MKGLSLTMFFFIFAPFLYALSRSSWSQLKNTADSIKVQQLISILIYAWFLLEAFTNPFFKGKGTVSFGGNSIMVLIAFVIIVTILLKVRSNALTKVPLLDKTWVLFVVDGTLITCVICILFFELLGTGVNVPSGVLFIPSVFLLIPLVYTKGIFFGPTNAKGIFRVDPFFTNRKGRDLVVEIQLFVFFNSLAIALVAAPYKSGIAPLWFLPIILCVMFMYAAMVVHVLCPTLAFRIRRALKYPNPESILEVTDKKGASVRFLIILTAALATSHLLLYTKIKNPIGDAFPSVVTIGLGAQILFLLCALPTWVYFIKFFESKVWKPQIKVENFPHVFFLGGTLLLIPVVMRLAVEAKIEFDPHAKIAFITSAGLLLNLVFFHPAYKKTGRTLSPVRPLALFTSMWGLAMLIAQILNVSPPSAVAASALITLILTQIDYINLRDKKFAPLIPRVGIYGNPVLSTMGIYGGIISVLSVVHEIYPVAFFSNTEFTAFVSAVYYIWVITRSGNSRGSLMVLPFCGAICSLIDEILTIGFKFSHGLNLFCLWFAFVFIIYAKAILAAASTTLLERKILAATQRRIGPIIIGFIGALQPIADAAKLIQKTSPVPQRAPMGAYVIAPFIALYLSIIPWSLIPIGPEGALLENSLSYLIFLAVASMSTFPIILASWASNNSYAFLGASRVVVQSVSFETFITVNFMVVFSIYGSSYPRVIIEAQRVIWTIGLFPSSAAFFMSGSLIESARAPFDITESEGELVSGPTVEYGGVLFMMFFLSEYMGVVLLSLIFTNLYLGGYTLGKFVKNSTIITKAIVGFKVAVVCVFFIWARTTAPRVRFNDLLRAAWRILLPGSVAQLYLAMLSRIFTLTILR